MRANVQTKVISCGMGGSAKMGVFSRRFSVILFGVTEPPGIERSPNVDLGQPNFLFKRLLVS